MLDSVKMTLLGLWARKSRTALTIVGILIAVSLVAGTQFAVDTTQYETGKVIMATGDDITVAKGSRGPIIMDGVIRTTVVTSIYPPVGLQNETMFDPLIVDQIRGISGVVDAVPRLTDYAVIGRYPKDEYSYDRFFPVQGVVPERDWVMSSMVIDSGELSLAGNNSLIPKTLADDLGTSVGRELNITFREYYQEGKNYTIISHNITTIVRAVYHYPSVSGLTYSRLEEPIYISLSVFQKTVNKTGVNVVAVRTYREGMDVDTYIENTRRVEQRLNFQFQGRYYVNAEKVWRIVNAQQGLFFLRLLLMAPSALTLVVSVFLVINVMLMSLEERKVEVGVLRSMGASSHQIFVTFISEAMLLGLLGTAAGIVSGLLTSRLILWAIPALVTPTAQPVSTQPETIYASPLSIAVSASSGLIVVLVAGWIPSRQATRITVNEALRPMMRGFQVARRGRWFFVGLLLTALGVLGIMSPLLVPEYVFGLALFPTLMGPFLMIGGTIILFTSLLQQGFGFISNLFRPLLHDMVSMVKRNISRASRWYKLTFAMLSLSLILMMVFSSGATAAVNLTRLDLYMQYGSDFQVSGLTVSNSTKLRAIEGVEEVCTLMRRSVQVNQTPTSAEAVFLNESTFLKVIKTEYLNPSNIEGMSWSDAFNYLAAHREGAIVTRETAKNLFIGLGQHYNLTVSQYGYKEDRGLTGKTYSVIVKVIAIADLIPGVYLPRLYGGYQNLFIASINPVKEKAPELLEERWTLTHMAKMRPAAIPSEVAKKIRTTFPEASITAVEETSRLQYESYLRVMQLVITFLSFSLVTSVIGLVISLLMSISERRREFGIMRAIGLSRGQALLSVMVEAVVISVIAYIAGIFCSTAIVTMVVGMIARTTMPYLTLQMILVYGFPWIIWLLVFLGLIAIAVVASVTPAYKTSRMNIVDVIRYG